MRHFTKNPLAFAWLFVFAALVANTVIDNRNYPMLSETEQKIAHTHTVREKLSEISTNLVYIESAVRGFVITGSPDFLVPVSESTALLQAGLAELDTMIDDRPDQQIRFADLKGRVESKLTWLNEITTMMETKGFEAARTASVSGEGLKRMERAQSLIKEMRGVESELLAQRTQSAELTLRASQASSLAGGGLSLVLGFIAYYLVNKEFQRRSRIESNLRESEKRFRVLSEAIPQKVWTADPTGRLDFVNHRWMEYTGLSSREASAGEWAKVVHPEDLPDLNTDWNMAVANKADSFATRCRFRRFEDGVFRWHHTTAISLKDEAGRVLQWIGSMTDIDDDVRQAEHLEELVDKRTQELWSTNQELRSQIEERLRSEEREQLVTEELRRSNSELETFAYVASHDLQEPLRKIQAFGDRLKNKAGNELSEQAQLYLDRMLDSAGRMRRLIEDLLTFSRIATNTKPFVEVDLNHLVGEVLSDLEYSIGKEVGTIEVDELPVLRGDAAQLRRLFQNLIANGLKFHKPNVHPKIEIRAVRLENVATDKPMRGWRIAVKDNGIGFDESYSDRIFEVFQRLHSRAEYEGTGIGLAICRKIVERHGGCIHASSRLGEGATFYLDFPEPKDDLDLN